MERITIKSYAVKHKLSIFNVMKMVKSGKLQSEVVEEKGRDVTYILLDEKTEAEVQKSIITVENRVEIQLQEEIKLLSNEVKLLRAEIEALKTQMNQ